MTYLPVIVSVKHIAGRGRGKKLGLATLNFAIPQALKIPYGIYAGWLETERGKYRTAIHFGPRPQFGESDPSLEAFVLNNEIISDKSNLKLQFVAFIRQVQVFPTTKAMLARIDEDVAEIQKILTTS